MDLVWPISGLYAGPLALWAHFTIGRLSTEPAVEEAKARGEDPPIVGEWALFLFPLTLLGHKIFGAWLVDYLIALAFGIVFRFLTIAPMRNLEIGEGLVEAAKADFLSLTAILEEGATYKYPESDCGCEVKVTKGAPAAEAGDDAPTCCCGAKMEKQ